MARVYEKLGCKVLPWKLEDIRLENNPQYDLYEDETQNEQIFLQLAEELGPMPEVDDHYLEAEIWLPRGDEMIRGYVVAQSGDASGNIMAGPTQIQFLVQGCIMLSLLEGRLQN